MDGDSTHLPPTYLSSGQEQGKSYEGAGDSILSWEAFLSIYSVLLGRNKPKNPKPNDHEKLSTKKAKLKMSCKHDSTTYWDITYGAFMFLLWSISTAFPKKRIYRYTFNFFFGWRRTYPDAPCGLTLAGNAHVVWGHASNPMNANSVNNFYKLNITYF